MNLIIIFCLTFIFQITKQQLQQEEDPGELKLVLELFRHGARGPLHEYYDFQEQKDNGIYGQLTPVGMHQHYQLGTEMRKEFIEEREFLSETYNLKEMEIFSSDVNRTIQSAYSHYFGFYPLQTGPQYKQNIQEEFITPPYINLQLEQDSNNFSLKQGFTTVPVHQLKQKEFILSEFCPNKDKLQKEYESKHPETEQYVWDHYGKELAEQLEKILKQDVKSLGDIKDVQDNFFSDIYQNRPLPKDLTKEMQEKMLFIYSFQWMYANQGKKNSVMSSELFRFIKSKMYQKIQIINQEEFEDKTPQFQKYLKEMEKRKWIGISGHDSNIVQIMIGLHLTSPQCLIDKFENKDMSKYINCLDAPLYASQFLFELYQKENEFYVKLRYNGKYLDICGKNQKHCKFETFDTKIEQYIVKDPWKECGMNRLDQWATPEDFQKYNLVERYEGKTQEQYFQKEKHFVLIFILIGLSVTLVILFVFLIKLYMQEKKDKNALIHRDGNKKWIEMA